MKFESNKRTLETEYEIFIYNLITVINYYNLIIVKIF